MKPIGSHPLHAIAPVAAVAVLAAACSGSGTSKASPGSSSGPPGGSSSSAPASSGNAAGGGYGGGKASTTAMAATVATTKNAQLGQILVNSRGRTLYLFLKDRGSTSSCSAQCAKVWPPLTTNGAPRPGTGATASLLGTTARSDGTKQVTYNGHPLYTYVADKQSGQTVGEGLDQFGAEWYALSARGSKVEKNRS